MAEAIALAAQPSLAALASLPALLDAAWKAAFPGKARLGVGEDAHHAGAEADLFAQALQPVGALPVLLVRPRQACPRRQGIDGEGLLDVRLYLIHAFWVLALPCCDPGSPSPAAPPPCLCGRRGQQSSFEAVVVGLAGQGVPGVRQEVHVLDTCRHIAWTPTPHWLDTHRTLPGHPAGCPPSRPCQEAAIASCPASRHTLPQRVVGAARDHATPCSITARHAPIGGRGDACVAHVACDVMPAR